MKFPVLKAHGFQISNSTHNAGVIVMTAFISPFRAEREMARELIGKENFVEVFVDTPLDVCEQRDPKGLYRKARQGQLPNMTGISSPYEPPLCPDYLVPAEGCDLAETVKSLTSLLQPTSPRN